MLDLTRILAGPVGTRALAAHGADVLLVNSPHLPNIEALAETSRGKLSAHADLREPAGRAAFEPVLRDAHVFVQGYRPGGLQQLGYGAEALAERHPGIVVVSLSAYGQQRPVGGPPRLRFAGADGQRLQHGRGAGLRQRAAARAADAGPRPCHRPPDGAGRHAPRCCASSAKAAAGGCRCRWRAPASGCAAWAGWRTALPSAKPDFTPYIDTTDSGFGRLSALRHAAQLSATPAGWERPSMPPGTHALAWPAPAAAPAADSGRRR